MPTEEPESIVDENTAAESDQTAAPQPQDKDIVLEEALAYFIENNPGIESPSLSRGGEASMWVSRMALVISAMALGVIAGREINRYENDRDNPPAKVSFEDVDYSDHPVYLEYLEQHEQLFEMSNDLIARLNNITAESLSRFDLEELDNYSQEMAMKIKEVSDKYEGFENYYNEIMMAASPKLATLIQRTHGQINPLRKEFRIGSLNFLDNLTAAYNSFLTIVDDTNFDREVLEEEGVAILFVSDDHSIECRIATQMIAHFDKENSVGVKALKVVANGQNERFSKLLEKEGIEIGVPSYIIFRDGKIVAHETGDLDTQSLDVLIGQALSGHKKKTESPKAPKTPAIPFQAPAAPKPPKARTIFI